MMDKIYKDKIINSMNKDKIIHLAKVIKMNPGCVLSLDRDSWVLFKRELSKEELTNENNDNLISSLILAESLNYEFKTSYDYGHIYGQAIFDALALNVGMKIEPV